jgi:hypothetical protein
MTILLPPMVEVAEMVAAETAEETPPAQVLHSQIQEVEMY